MSSSFKTLKSTDDAPNRQTATFIPYLPDNVIEKILSFLPINRAAQANTVSKQWAALWPSFPVIDLNEGDPINCDSYFKRQRFLNLLHHSLRRCRNQRSLVKLRIRAKCDFACGEGLVREWVGFAIQRCLKELDILNLDENKLNKHLLITHDVLTLKSLTSLKLENVRLYAGSGINGPVSLPSLKTMSLKDVTFLDFQEETATDALPSLLSGCPCIEHLSVDSCKLGYSTRRLQISSHSLKSLKIMHCHCMILSVSAKELESFRFYSDCTCCYDKSMYLWLWECYSLKHVDISCKGLKQLLLHNCLETMESLVYAPNLEIFDFCGYLKTKVNFLEAPSNLVNCIIRVWETERSIEYYSAMIDFLESFDCSRKVKIHIEEAEGVIIPEHCRLEWFPPLPSIKQLQLCFSAPLGGIEDCLRRSLLWMAPSAEILPFRDIDDNGDDYEDRVDNNDDDLNDGDDDEVQVGYNDDDHNDEDADGNED